MPQRKAHLTGIALLQADTDKESLPPPDEPTLWKPVLDTTLKAAFGNAQNDVKSAADELSAALDLRDHKADVQQAALLNLYTSVLQFGARQQWTIEQTALLLRGAQALLQCAQSSKGKAEAQAGAAASVRLIRSCITRLCQ